MLSEASVCDETQESGSDHRFHTVGILGGAQPQRLNNERKVYGDCDIVQLLLQAVLETVR